MTSREGQRVPEASFRIIEDGVWKTVTTAELFAGKTVILFALPGAFTPTCSSTHVPRYEELSAKFAAAGVDDIVCLSVNDTFVMNAWKQDQHAEHITFIPDGNGDFSRAMGTLVDKNDLGFGPRSWRYSMLVRDGVIEKQFIEPVVDGDPFEVSDADTMLGYIAPQAVADQDILLMTRPGCSFCARAKSMLQERGLPYAEVDATPRMLRAASGSQRTPQVFIDGKHIGGADELAQHLSP
ncbi:MAG: glutathione peroxidase [Acidobacteriota bacterium]